jgi:acetyl esterase/lipase
VIAARLLLILGMLAVVGAVNALMRPNHDRSWHLRPWWLFAMLTGELVFVRFAIRLVVVLLLAAFGALEHRAGVIGAWLVVAAWMGHVVLVFRSLRARSAMRQALAEEAFEPGPRIPVPARRILVGNPYPLPAGVERVETLEFMPGMHLDLYKRAGESGPRPVMLQVHGGSWRGGNRRQQARPLLHTLALNGWIGAAASYPLVPKATIEDQVIALKRAIAWLRNDGVAFGIDPSFVAVTGGSAGAHLASLVALTGGLPEYQPGFEEADTSVQAAVSFYGIYDLLNRNRTRDDWPIIGALMRTHRRDDAARYRASSPLDRITPAAPPFLAIHGTHDSVVSIAESDQFVAALREQSTAPTAYARIPGATHGFDTVYSVRSHLVVAGIVGFLEAIRTGLRAEG